MMVDVEVKMRWIQKMNKCLQGRKIVAVSIMDAEGTEQMHWDNPSVVLHLDDGNILFPSADDEGNNAGALFTSYDDLPTLPVF